MICERTSCCRLVVVDDTKFTAYREFECGRSIIFPRNYILKRTDTWLQKQKYLFVHPYIQIFHCGSIPRKYLYHRRYSSKLKLQQGGRERETAHNMHMSSRNKASGIPPSSFSHFLPLALLSRPPALILSPSPSPSRALFQSLFLGSLQRPRRLYMPL